MLLAVAGSTTTKQMSNLLTAAAISNSPPHVSLLRIFLT